MYMDEEDAFWTMISILNKFGHEKFFMKGMLGLWQSFYILMKLIKDQLPKLFEHFIKNGFTCSMYATQWFLTIFTVGIPYQVTIRIYDAFFTEGPKVLYRVALYILKKVENELLESTVDDFRKIIGT